MRRPILSMCVFLASLALPAAAHAYDKPCATIDVAEGAHSVSGLGGGADAAIQGALQTGLPHAQVQTQGTNAQWLQSTEQEQAASLAQAQQDMQHGVDRATALAQMDARDAAWMAAHPPPAAADVIVEWSAMPLGTSVVLTLRAIGSDGKNYYGNYAALDASAADTAATVLGGWAAAAASAIAPNFVCMALAEHLVKIPWPCQTSHTFEVDLTDLTGAPSKQTLTVIFSLSPASVATVSPQAPSVTGSGQTMVTLKSPGSVDLNAKVSPQHQKDQTDSATLTGDKDGKIHVNIDGVRLLDAEQLWNMKSSPLGVLITPFRTMLQANGAWTFYGKGTEADHLSGTGTIDGTGTTVAFQTTWAAHFNTPEGAMESPAASVSFHITPYTVTNTVELDATANGTNATTLHFAPNLVMLGTPVGLSGAGFGTIHIPGGEPISQNVPLTPSQQMGAFFMMTPFDMKQAADGTWPKKSFSGSDEGGSWVYTVAICGGS